MSEPLKVFITYSHKNKAEKDKLIECLAVMIQQDMITIWHDNEILPGDSVMLQIEMDFCGALISYKLGCPQGGVHVEEA